MEESINPLEVLGSLLRCPLEITGFKHRDFPAGSRTPDEVIVSHRFLVVRGGSLDYTVEGRRARLGEGDQFFVPAWCRREWRTLRGCELIWCEFSSGEVRLPPVLCRRAPDRLDVETNAFESMFACVNGDVGRRGLLLVEGELKAALARFWVEAKPCVGGSKARRQGPAHPEVARALAWLGRHYGEPDALESFYRTLELSPNHFRLLFRRQTGETVQAVLARLRMRRARYLVCETDMLLKQVAAESGFADPMYFSRHYRRFWGRAPLADRDSETLA